jgi:hypothetical protein
VQRDATIPGLDAGTRAEVRVAQAWYWDGYYVRRGIDLQHRFGNDVSTVTDLDVLGYAFDASLTHHKRIGEVKTGTSKTTPRPLDRALWMRGLRELVGAEHSEVTTAFSTSPAMRDACRRLGTSIQHLDDLDAREKRLNIAQVVETGSQGDTIAKLRKDVQSFAKRDVISERAFWFLTSEVWFLEPVDALKRTLGLIRELGKVWPPETHQDAMRAARWFFAEAISIATLNLAIIAGEANTMNAQTFQSVATARLAAGDVPYYAMRKLAERVDEYVAKLLGSIDAPAEVRTTAMGAFVPVPPDYAEPLLELISRLAVEAATTATLPRLLDAVIFERLVRRRDVTPELTARLGIIPATERYIRLVAAFLRGQFNLPEAVDKVLTTPIHVEPPTGAAAPQPMLFDAGKGNSGNARPAAG